MVNVGAIKDLRMPAIEIILEMKWKKKCVFPAKRRRPALICSWKHLLLGLTYILISHRWIRESTKLISDRGGRLQSREEDKGRIYIYLLSFREFPIQIVGVKNCKNTNSSSDRSKTHIKCGEFLMTPSELSLENSRNMSKENRKLLLRNEGQVLWLFPTKLFGKKKP